MVARIVHPSLEGVILKPGKPFPGVHFQKSALQGHPHHCEVLVSMRRAEKFPPYSTVFGARSSSVCSQSLGIRAAEALTQCPVPPGLCEDGSR